jgi:hypothetical protein
MPGRWVRETATTRASISTITASRTASWRSTSRSVPPSPPPTISTRCMAGAVHGAGCTSISW